MKTIIVLLIASTFLMNASAGNLPKQADTYCAKIKDGIKVIIHQGYILTSDATLNNGTKIHTDGTIVQKDGTTTSLKEGECISKEGVMTGSITKKNKSK